MKKITLVFFVLVLVIQTKAQLNKKFDKTYGAQNLDVPVFIDFKGENHYVFGNIKNSALPLDIVEQFGNSDYNMVIYDALGNIVENKSFGGSGNEVLDKVIPNNTGGYFLIGTSTSPLDGNKTTYEGCEDNKVYSYQIDYIHNYERVSSGYNDLGVTVVRTDYFNTPEEAKKKELYIVEIDSSGNKLGDYSICTEVVNYYTISGTTGSVADSIAYFAKINDVKKDINGNYLVSYTYFYEDYVQDSYDPNYTVVPDWWTVPCCGDVYPHTARAVYVSTSGAFHSGVMVFDNNWLMISNKLNIYIPLDPSGSFSMHSGSTPLGAAETNRFNMGNDVYSLPSGGYLWTGEFCSTEFATWTGLTKYFAGAYITDGLQNVVYSKTFFSPYSENKIVDTYFDGTYYYLFIEDIPLSTGTTNYQTSFLPGSYAGYGHYRTAPARTASGKKDIWVLKLTNTLQVISEAAIGCSVDTYLSSVIKRDGSNNLILSCYTKGAIGFDKTTLSRGGYDYWLVEFDPTTMAKVSDWSFGGSGDDILTYTNNKLGFFQYTGTSKSPISWDKTEASRDGGALGDYWTLSYCVTPIADFTANYDSASSGQLVSFTNLSTYTSVFYWDFGDGTYSYQTNPVHYYYMPGYYTVKLNAINPVGCVDSITKSNFIYVNPVGIVEAIGEKNIGVFPNPATDEVYVVAENKAEIKIFDSYGKKVIERKVLSDSDNVIDVRNLKAGMYYINVTTANKVRNTKLIKK